MADIVRVPNLPFLREVEIRNYKSIKHCRVRLGALTLIVGRNAAGKSNFLDVLRFVSDALRSTLDHAIMSRGGFGNVRRRRLTNRKTGTSGRRGTNHPRSLSVAFVWEFPALAFFSVSDVVIRTAFAREPIEVRYSFELASQMKGDFIVNREELEFVNTVDNERKGFGVREGKIAWQNPGDLPSPSLDRLLLVSASGFLVFRPVFDALSSMSFYNFNSSSMKELQPPDAGEFLRHDGANIASVISRLAAENPAVLARMKEYLRTIVPGIEDVERVTLGRKETLRFQQRTQAKGGSMRFDADQMSDGTLRALGALTAVTQLALRGNSVTVAGIEEPETALHPGAAGALMDALREASAKTQVIVTTHSPDLLDQVRPESDNEVLLVADATSGSTVIGPVDEASKSAIRDRLYSPGELLRMDQLQVGNVETHGSNSAVSDEDFA